MSLYSFVNKPQYVAKSGLALLAQQVLATPIDKFKVNEVKVGE